MRLTPWRKQQDLSRDLPGTSPLRLFRAEMDRLFDSFFGGSPWEGMGLSSASAWTPDLELSESDQEVVVRAELPGMNAEDIDVRIDGNLLTISGEKKEEFEDRKGGNYRSERRYGMFRRSVELPPGTKSDQVAAEFEKGVLTLRMPKDQAAASRKIEIKGAAKSAAEPRKEAGARPEQARKKSGKE